MGAHNGYVHILFSSKTAAGVFFSVLAPPEIFHGCVRANPTSFLQGEIFHCSRPAVTPTPVERRKRVPVAVFFSRFAMVGNICNRQ